MSFNLQLKNEQNVLQVNSINCFSGLKPSKLRHALRFRWTQSMLGQLTENQHDAVFEAANLLMNIAFWYMKHSAMICAKEDLKVNYSNRSVN